MSKKRFSFNGIYFVDNETGQMSHNATEKTLNLLYDENEQLRQEVAHWKHQADKLAKALEMGGLLDE